MFNNMNGFMLGCRTEQSTYTQQIQGVCACIPESSSTMQLAGARSSDARLYTFCIKTGTIVGILTFEQDKCHAQLS